MSNFLSLIIYSGLHDQNATSGTLPSFPVAGIASPSLFLGFAFKKKNLYKAWIQRWPGVDTEMARRGYSDVLFLGFHFFFKTL